MVEEGATDSPSDRPVAHSDEVRLETPDGANVSDTVMLAVEELTGASMEELPLLGRSINVDALDDLFEPVPPGVSDTVSGTLQFEYSGCTVTADSDGTVVVRPTVEGPSVDTLRDGDEPS